MLTIKNIASLKGSYIGHWKILYVGIENDTYLIKVIHNGSPFDCFNLMIDRRKQLYGDYRIWCIETNFSLTLPITDIKDRDTFIRFLIDELI